MTKTSIVLLILLSSKESQQLTFTNPVIDSNHPDPGVLKLPNEIGQGFVAVSTSNYANDPEKPAFPMLYSENLVNWDEVGFVFEGGKWPLWARGDMWAPEIHFVNGRFMVYFSARKKSNSKLAIGVAISTDPKNPFGPYEDYGTPIIEDFYGAIDIHYFKDPKSMNSYLVWKTDDNAVLRKSKMWIQQVEENGITFTESTERILIMSAEKDEDRLVVEGGSIIFKDPFYYLFFSSSGYNNPKYHVNVARSTKLEAYFEERFDEILHTDYEKYDAGFNCTFVGPGHGTPIQLETGQDWYVYHTWKYGLVDVNPPGRVMNLDPISWTDSRWPFIGVPSDFPIEIEDDILK